ncbi:hypothetical protein [Demequina sp. NBRC 110057]|uniref:hypothetical protein n=1 Tax=Demequina sp. NBRC 110057 TaxID=1570346 RepID=UPI0013567228|nr:hypothetical protein [Demequina sp. NBRC 110057]
MSKTVASRRLDGRLGAAAAAAPERIVLVVIAVALAGGAMASVGLHYWWTVLPLAALLVALAWRPLASDAPTPGQARAGAIAGIVAVAGTAVWTVVNVAMAAEYLLVVRDPGFLTLSGLWLVDHPSTDIPADGAVEAAASGASMLADASEAWNLAGDVIQPQGAKMLPATIAVGGWFAGDTGVLAANVVIGAAGILATFALARRFLSPLAALAPAGALALTVSHIGLSRPAYTEPLALLLAVGGILYVWRGIERRSTTLIVAGAIATGATTFVRIDGASGAIGSLVGVAVALAVVEAPRAWRRAALAKFALVEAVVLVAGYVALHRWSAEYFERLESEAYLLLAAYGVLVAVILGWAATWTDTLRGDAWLPGLSARLGTRGAWWIGGAVMVVMVGLASRPLWTTGHRGTETSREEFTNGVVEGFQSAQGLPVDGTRNYAESTVSWLSYYLTWPMVILAIIGLGWATMRMVRRDAPWAVLLGSMLAPTLLYLVKPAIVPDQIWAIRRFEPITLPGMLLMAAVAAWWLASRLPRASARHVARRVAGVGMVALPLTTWVSIDAGAEYPIASAVNVTTREMNGARDMIDGLCALDDGRPIVLVGTSEMYGGLRVMCDEPVVLALSAPTEEQLVEMADAWGEQPFVVTRQVDDVPWTDTPEPVLAAQVKHSSYTLGRLPRTLINRDYTWYAGVVNEDGSVAPLSAVPTATAP